ncbi:MAG TPA: endopeptidase La [Anaerolineae bacterium]|nr:endopeptidase La [Anaerolineae bacterium]
MEEELELGYELDFGLYNMEGVVDEGEGSLPEDLPLLPLRDTVVFPHMMTPLMVGRDRSMKALEAATSGDELMVVVAQRDPEVEEPGLEDLYTIGVELVVGRSLRMPDGTTNILGQGRRRVEILGLSQTRPYIRATVRPLPESRQVTLGTEALMRAVLSLFEKVVQLSHGLPEDAYVAALNVSEPGPLADLIASLLDLKLAERQELLEILDPPSRLQRLSVFLANELDVLELEYSIHDKVQQEVDRSQREFYLREQMRAIQSELGEMDIGTAELQELAEKLAQTEMPEEVQAKAQKELGRLRAIPPGSPETAVIRTYLDWLLELPWFELTEDNLDIAQVARALDANHYGLPRAKERILEYLAVRKLSEGKPSARSPILCFVGPPGTGKTSLGRSIAEALGRRFVRVSLGGIRDEAEIRGHRRTYIGALPGRVVQTMRTAGTMNPLFMLDEIDKVGLDFRGDPSAALLEVLDPEQNNSFSDHYLDVPYDLSKVMFITTANVLDPVPPALRDRMEVIEFPGYIEEEKLAIARQFLIPRQLMENGLDTPERRLSFSEKALRVTIRDYTYEAGVRNLEREIANVCRKIARRVAEEKPVPRHITVQSLTKYLGPPRFLRDEEERTDEVGLAIGIAWTEAGGDILPVEVSLMDGKGALMLTGQLGEVMQESAQAAISYARSHANELDIGDVDFDKLDIHIHVPEGAIPKDGPSAGITMATALISALIDRPVHRDVAMTGEITLRGRVLPIGGLKEKVLAAHRAGLKTVLLPKQNKKDMVEIPKRVKRDLKFIFVERMDQVLPVALLPEVSPETSRKASASGAN